MGDKNHDINKQCSMESNPGTKPETQQPVIRTKAVRCTKVIIPWQLHNHQMVNKNISPVWDCDSPSCSAQQDDNSYGFLKDFDINDLLISGVLYSDQDKEIINECEIVVDGDQVQVQVQPKNMYISCPDDHQDFPVSRDDHRDQAKHEDSMDGAAAARPDNWRDSQCSHDPFLQPNDALDLTTLASFLNSEDEWIS